MKIRIFCDESCHLEKDDSDVMALGAVWGMQEDTQIFSRKIALLKLQHQMPAATEIKWSKLSKKKLSFLEDLIEAFFQSPGIHFRAIVVTNKKMLDHSNFFHTHG